MKIPLLLAANWQELISFLAGLVFFVFWLLNQVSEARKKPGPVMGQPAALPPQPPPPGAMAQAPPPADPLRAQVDEFLRRAAQQAQQPSAPVQGPRRLAAQGPPRQPARDDIIVLLDEAPAEAKRGSRAPLLRPVAETPTPQPSKPSPPPRRQPRRVALAGASRPKSVAEHVAEHVAVSTQQFRDEVAHLGERVKRADEQFDVQLQRKFDHELSSLAERPSASAYDQQAAPAAATLAAQIAAMLTTPDGARQAIVLNEILRRPDEQW